MKRIRIWLSGFSLVQQFIAVAILTVSVTIIFTVSFLNKKIDTFVSGQIYEYLHHYQQAYIVSEKSTLQYDDENVEYFIYNPETNYFLNNISDEYKYLITYTNLNVYELYDGAIEINNKKILYSITPLPETKYNLLTYASDKYVTNYKYSISENLINFILYLIIGLFFLFLLWVTSLIRPLNKIIAYIDNLKTGEKTELKLERSDEIGQVGEALIEMNEELSHQQRIREEMVQNISHDLKTPIATIKSYSESIKDGVYPYDTLEKSVDVIIDHANRLEKKAYNLNTFNKLEYLVDTENETNIAEVIQKIILSTEAIRHEIKIETDIDETVMFHGEEEPWRTAIENLIENALRYAKTTVRISLSDRLLEVFDDGELMSKDRLAKLFKPYEKGTKGNFGLGLSIVKKVCDTYGYAVVGDNMNDGVIFRIYTNRKSNQKRLHIKATKAKL